VGAELFHADGQTDMTNLIVAFRNFAKSRKMTGATGVVKAVFLIASECVSEIGYFQPSLLRFGYWLLCCSPTSNSVPAPILVATVGKAAEAWS
jgi:hypothetical protein